MSGLDDGYELAITRITELEVDLANAVSGLKRSQADNESLIANQAELMGSYKRLQDHHERNRRQLHQEQEARGQVAEEHQQQIALWRSQIEQRDRDIQEVQSRRMAPRELDALHLQLAEEIEEPYRRQVRDMEARLADAQQRGVEVQRQMEMQRLEQKHMDQEASDQLAEQMQRQEVREQSLQRQISTLEAEVRKQLDEAAGTWHVKMQMQEQEAKSLGLQNALQEQERCSSQQSKALADDLLMRNEELAVARRRIYELQVEVDSQERMREQVMAEAQGLGCEKVKLSASLAEAKAQLANTKPAEDSDQLREELAQVKRTVATEREQLLKRASTAEEQLQASHTAFKHMERESRQLLEERAEREQEFQSESAKAEEAHSAEMSKLRLELDKSSREAETRRVALHEKERDSARQVESLTTQVETLSGDLEQAMLTQEETEKRLQDVRRDLQQRLTTSAEKSQQQLSTLQSDLAALRERASSFERERDDQAAAADTARTALQAQEQRANALQTELDALSQRLNTERSQWVREADDAHVAATRLVEEKRSEAMQQLAGDHKRQIAKLNASYKKALQQGDRKRKELKQRCQECMKRMAQLQQEKNTAVRICEENKGCYELRLAELGLVSRLGLGNSVGVGSAEVVGIGQPTVLRADASVGGAGVMHRRELRAIMERLEQNSERLHTTAPAASEAVTTAS